MTMSGEVRRGRLWPVAAFLGYLLISVTWALTSPLMAVPDEAAHVTRAVSLWQGDLLGRPFDFTNEETGQDAVLFEVHVPASFQGIGDQTDCFREGGPAGCGPPLTQRDGLALQATAAGAYHPLWYALTGLPSRLLGPVEAIYGGRLLQALAGSLFVAATVWLGGALAGRLGVALVLLGVTPTTLFLLGAINPNGMEIAAASTLWLAVLALVRAPEDRRVAVLVAVAAFGTAWSRPLSPAIATGICLAAMALTLDRQRWDALRASLPARYAAVGAGAAIASAAVWVAWSGGLATFVGAPQPGLTPGVAASLSWSLTAARLEQMIGTFGLVNVPLPGPATALWAAALLVAMGGALWWASWRQRVVMGSLVAATLALPVLAEAMTAREMGITWQGRYTIPVAFGVIASMVWAAHDRPPPRWVAAAALPVVALVLVVAHVAGHLQTISRYSTGRGSSLTGYLSNPVWSPPGGPDIMLLVVTALGAVVVATAPWLVPPASDA